MFEMRDTPQDSTGFTPFEQIYGRTVRTPMSLLRKLWTEEEKDSEVKTAYQYVIDLRERLEETCEMAQQQLSKVQDRNIITDMQRADTSAWATACYYCCQQSIIS